MMVNSDQAGGDGGARPPPFTLSTITSKVVVLQLRGNAIQYSFFSSVVLHMLDVLYSYCTYAHIFLTHYPSTDMGKIISDKLFISDFFSRETQF